MPQATFCELTISYDERVLEPRSWTQAQSAWAAELLAELPPGPVLELCAGAGHIGLGAVRGTQRELVMVDLNPVAEQFALENAAANGMGDQVEFRLGRIDAAVAPDEQFSLIIADPPWVRSAETSSFPEDPLLAIDGGADGLALARTCVDLMDRHLPQEGSGLLQLGTTSQAESIAGYAADSLEGSLQVSETQVYDRGVLVRLVR